MGAKKEIRIDSSRLTVLLTVNPKENDLCTIAVYVKNAVRVRKNLEYINDAFDKMPFDDFIDNFVDFLRRQVEAFELKNASSILIDEKENFVINENLNSIYIGKLDFPKERILDVGDIEKWLVTFDMRLNGQISAMSFIYSDALALVRKAFLWEEGWNSY